MFPDEGFATAAPTLQPAPGSDRRRATRSCDRAGSARGRRCHRPGRRAGLCSVPSSSVLEPSPTPRARRADGQQVRGGHRPAAAPAGAKDRAAGQHDRQADALGADILGAAVGGLHHARPAPGHDHEATLGPVPLAGARNQARERARRGVDALRVEYAAASAGAGRPPRARGCARCRTRPRCCRCGARSAAAPVSAAPAEGAPAGARAQQELPVGESEAVARRARLGRVGLAFGPGQILAGARQSGRPGARLAHAGSTRPRAGAGRQSSAAPSPPGTKM
jgi:hypothetical protein